MSSNKKYKNNQEPKKPEAQDVQEQLVDVIEDISPVEEGDSQVESLENDIQELNRQLEEEKKKYMFLYADFDNFRKRSIKEKAEIIKNGGEDAFKGLLPILDDFERGIDAAEKAGEGENKQMEGFILIYNKLKKYLEQKGVKEFEDTNDTFDADRHEAISAIPAPTPEMKGKIIDTVQKGYTINGKILRHAKVVVGQ